MAFSFILTIFPGRFKYDALIEVYKKLPFRYLPFCCYAYFNQKNSSRLASGSPIMLA